MGEKHSVSIEAGGRLEPGEIELRVLSARLSVELTLDRAEARDLAYRLIECSQWMWEEGL